jgi:hypothetical protein
MSPSSRIGRERRCVARRVRRRGVSARIIPVPGGRHYLFLSHPRQVCRRDASVSRRSALSMDITQFPFDTTDWDGIEPTEHPGETGTAQWRTRHFGTIRVRMVEYSPGYRADHWCEKGHILLCLEGELETELRDGRRFQLRPGMSYQVGDGADAHRSSTATGATLFIVD